MAIRFIIGLFWHKVGFKPYNIDWLTALTARQDKIGVSLQHVNDRESRLSQCLPSLYFSSQEFLQPTENVRGTSEGGVMPKCINESDRQTVTNRHKDRQGQ